MIEGLAIDLCIMRLRSSYTAAVLFARCVPGRFPLAGYYKLAIIGFPYNFLHALNFLAKNVSLIYMQMFLLQTIVKL